MLVLLVEAGLGGFQLTFSPNSVATRGVLTVRVTGCLIGGVRNVTGLHSPRDLRAFRLCRLRDAWRERVLFETALSLWRRARFRTWWITFPDRRRGNLVFWTWWWPISWQTQ